MKNTKSRPRSLSRRHFVGRTCVGAAVAYLASAKLTTLAAPSPRSREQYDISILEKWYFDGGDGTPDQVKYRYTPEQTAEVVDEIGLDLELTVRKAGHISPERVPEELPAMVKALACKNRRISYLAMDTVRPDEPYWEKALRVGKELGINRYRHRGFKYDLARPRKAQIPAFTSMAREFAAANKEIGVQAVYQIHAGAVMAGSAAWDLDMILADIDPKYFGVAIDAQHVMVEQGLSWPNAIDLLAPRTTALCVKSFRWELDQKLGEYRPLQVPLGQGYVKKDFVRQVIAAHGGPLPIIIHIEHYKNAAGDLYPVAFDQRKGIVEAFRADARVLREWLGAISAT